MKAKPGQKGLPTIDLPNGRFWTGESPNARWKMIIAMSASLISLPLLHPPVRINAAQFRKIKTMHRYK